MATVHPSRMRLVPSNPNDHNRQANHGSSSNNRGRSRSPGGDRQRDRDRPFHRGRSPSGGSRERGRDRDSGRSRYDERDRDQERDRGRGDGDRDANGDRRAPVVPRRSSPAYGEYKKEERREDVRAPDVPESAPWRRNENMDRGHGGYGGGNSFENTNLESRAAQRDTRTVDVWPPSPKAPARELSPRRGKSSKRHRRDPSSDSDSSEEERRRRKKDKKRARKEKERRDKGDRKERPSGRRRSRSRDEDSESDRDRERRRRRHRRSESRGRSRSRDLRRPEAPAPKEEEDEWVVKDGPSTAPALESQLHAVQLADDSIPAASRDMQDGEEDEEDDDDLGPQPFSKIAKKVDERAYGGALLRGEGSAMAAFLADDTKARIPRRGEIGLTSDQIESYETVGYVMSGSRHRRMNAVRMRKENQVISAEEKRGILKLQQEERSRREAILREEFSELVADKLKQTGAKQ